MEKKADEEISGIGRVTELKMAGSKEEAEFLKIAVLHYILGVLGTNEMNFPLELLRPLADDKVLLLFANDQFVHLRSLAKDEAEKFRAEHERQQAGAAKRNVH